MQIQGKALYNLLRRSFQENPAIAIEPWKVENYRILPTEILWQRLHDMGVALNEQQFLLYAEGCESPEELTELLSVEDLDAEQEDRLYLVIFEIWRRLLPKKTTLSLFCDELDYRMDQYVAGTAGSEELLQESLHELENILDQNADEVENPKELFLSVVQYCAHDLESFLYDYIALQMDSDDEEYASELLDGFYPYVADGKWFDFLRARLFFLTDEEQGSILLRGLMENLQESPDVDLLLEIADFLVPYQQDELLFQALKTAFSHLGQEEDFYDWVAILIDYYDRMGKEKEKALLADLIERRKSEKTSFDKSDPDLKKIKKMLEEAI